MPVHRRITHSIAIVIGIVLALAGAMPAQAQIDGAVLPSTPATTLAGAALTLPVPGKITLLAVGFSRSSGSAAGVAWKQIQPFCAAHPQIACYQVAVLQDAPGWIRSMIERGLRHARTQAEREQFVTVVTNEQAWKQALQDADANAGYAVLSAADGRILWAAHGTEATMRIDMATLAAALPK